MALGAVASLRLGEQLVSVWFWSANYGGRRERCWHSASDMARG